MVVSIPTREIIIGPQMVKWSVVSNMRWFGQTVWWKSSTYSAPNYFNMGYGCVIIDISCHGFRMSRWWSELLLVKLPYSPDIIFWMEGRNSPPLTSYQSFWSLEGFLKIAQKWNKRCKLCNDKPTSLIIENMLNAMIVHVISYKSQWHIGMFRCFFCNKFRFVTFSFSSGIHNSYLGCCVCWLGEPL